MAHSPKQCTIWHKKEDILAMRRRIVKTGALAEYEQFLQWLYFCPQHTPPGARYWKQARSLKEHCEKHEQAVG